MSLSLPQKLEGILFYFGEEMSFSELAELTTTTQEEVKNALSDLELTLQDRGISLSIHNDTALLTTDSELSPLIKKIREDEQSGELSKAAQEILSIILYAGPISKAHIDFIRGVNSQVSIRNLSVRGLIEKSSTSLKHRTEYVATHEFLNSLGATKASDLERYSEIRGELLQALQVTQEEK